MREAETRSGDARLSLPEHRTVTAEERMFQVECCVSATWKEKEYVMRPKPSEEEIRQRAKQLWEQKPR